MHTNQLNVDRKSLNFSKMVVENFWFLGQKFGFKLVEESDTLVRYRSRILFVNIYHGRNSYEVGFEIGRLKDKLSNVYRLPVIMRAVAPEYKGQTLFQAIEKESLEFCINRIAEIVRTYCHDLLIANNYAFKAVDDAEKSFRKEAMYEYTVRPVKNKALEAWQKKDYKEVVHLYETIKTELDEIERKRLTYAKKKS